LGGERANGIERRENLLQLRGKMVAPVTATVQLANGD
jgi:hypothetical protein